LIIGLGVDLCEVRRLRSLVERYGDRVLERLFTERERERCRGRRRFECLAGRFAAKEAALKALGTGLSNGIAWRDVELARGEYQRPTVLFHNRAKEIHDLLGARSSHVSITHDGGHAVAVVVLEGQAP
jgi:holo-[acyl-carrier protein] synthase